jgi:hypothetical protein
MKKTVTLIHCISFAIQNLPANSVSGIYYFLNINSDITCFIDLYPNNQYDLSLIVSHTNDINEEMPISSGKYKKTSNGIIFTDIIHGFTMQFRQNANKSITGKQGFAFMKDKVLTYCTGNAKKNNLSFYKIQNQKQERSNIQTVT